MELRAYMTLPKQLLSCLKWLNVLIHARALEQLHKSQDKELALAKQLLHAAAQVCSQTQTHRHTHTDTQTHTEAGAAGCFLPYLPP